jgi:eukaryotic-like serine/threonine-protein kinase
MLRVMSGPDELHDASTMPAGDTPPQTGPRERPPAFADGTVLAGRYRIVRFIARGGMGEVYEAEDQELRERVALKTIHPDRVGDQRAVDRFKREIHLARKVTHRNVCRLFDVGFHDTTTFLTMELLQGETLAERIHKAGRFAAADALPIVQQMADALDAAHAAGIVHRDFKSQNVMLCGTRVVVTDFGLARGPQGGADAHLSRSGEIVGSPGYMSPEQVEGREVGPPADVYALGVVLFEMMTGRLPFVADTPLATAIKRLKQPPPSPRESAAELDAVWENTILRCLSIVPQERFATAGAVTQALGAPRSTRFETLRMDADESPRKRWWLVAIPALIVLLGLGVYILMPRAKPGQATAPAHRSIAVVGFRNTTGRTEAAWLGGVLADMFSVDLGADPTLRTGADLVVGGSYVALGNRVRVDVHMQDAAAGQTLASLSETGQQDALVDLVSRAGTELRRKMGAPELDAAAAANVRATLQQLADRAAAASHVGQ